MVEQLSVFLQNKPGKIAAITAALAQNGIDVRALSIADTTDFGVLRMLVSDISAAKAVLAQHKCIVSATAVTVVAVPDLPGGLAQVLGLLNEGNIDIEYMYSLIGRGESNAYMVFRVTEQEKLLNLLKENGIESVSRKGLGIC